MAVTKTNVENNTKGLKGSKSLFWLLMRHFMEKSASRYQLDNMDICRVVLLTQGAVLILRGNVGR